MEENDYEFHIETENTLLNGEVAVMALQGRISSPSSSNQLDQTLQEFLKKGGRKILLNMDGLRYVNSAGLGTLLYFSSRLKENGGSVHLLKADEFIWDLVDMVGLSNGLKNLQTIDEAETLFR